MRGKTLWAMLFIVPALIGGVLTAAVLLTPLPEPDNPELTEILDASGKPVASLFTENRVEIPVDRMPKNLLNAIVAIEDDRFYRHRGIDPIGIGRAFVRNIQAGRVLQGGSTLTMQLARNLSFGGTRLGQQRTITRKLKEALLTIKLEYKYSKEQILGLYWNTIYLGRGAYGLERAAQTYFGKSLEQVPADQPLNLTLAEAAVLASLPQAPEYYSTDKGQAALESRKNLVLSKMAEQGHITPEEAEAAKRQTVTFQPPKKSRQEEVAYFVDYVNRELAERHPDVAGNLYRGGYRIFTTLDMSMQMAANSAVKEGLATIEGSTQETPEIALVAMDPETGYIRALVGGRDSAVERNRVLEKRQPGSTFKPFVYATALSTRQYVVTSTQPDVKREFPGAEAGKPWIVKNWDDEYSNRPETMRTALKRSLNTVTAGWMDVLKPEPVIELATKVGLESEYRPNLTIGLGSTAVTPLQMTTAFAALSNGGYRVVPIAVLRVEDREGKVYVEQSPSRTQALDTGVAFIVTELLKEVLRPGGTGSLGGSILGGQPAAGKSGTTDDSRDAWFVGYTPSLVAGVWTGYDDARPTRLLGGAHVSPIWGRFMREALAGITRKDWTPPPGVVAQEICSTTGLRPNASCPVGWEWYLKGTAPTRVDPTVHWPQVVPRFPGVPWAPPGTLPPGGTETPETTLPEREEAPPAGAQPPGTPGFSPPPAALPGATPPPATLPGATPPASISPGATPPASTTPPASPSEPVIRAPDAPPRGEPELELESLDEADRENDPSARLLPPDGRALQLYPAHP